MRFGDFLALLVSILIGIIIICLVVLFVCTIIDACTMELINQDEVCCQIVHMDIDNRLYYITFVGNDISKTVKVNQEVYAMYKEGDSITVLVTKYHAAVQGEWCTYEIKN